MMKGLLYDTGTRRGKKLYLRSVTIYSNKLSSQCNLSACRIKIGISPSEMKTTISQ